MPLRNLMSIQQLSKSQKIPIISRGANYYTTTRTLLIKLWRNMKSDVYLKFEVENIYYLTNYSEGANLRTPKGIQASIVVNK